MYINQEHFIVKKKKNRNSIQAPIFVFKLTGNLSSFILYIVKCIYKYYDNKNKNYN